MEFTDSWYSIPGAPLYLGVVMYTGHVHQIGMDQGLPPSLWEKTTLYFGIELLFLLVELLKE